MRDKRRLFLDKTLFGTILSEKPTDEQFGAMRHAGFDFVLVDCDRSYFSPPVLGQVCRDAKKRWKLGIVIRLKLDSGVEVLARCREMGADGFLLPPTEDLGRIREVAGFCSANSVCLMLQIASGASAVQLPAIMDIEGVDAAFIGPKDLARGLGTGTGLAEPGFHQAVKEIVKVSRKSGKYIGVHTGKDPRVLKAYLHEGITIAVLSSAAELFHNAAQEEVNGLRTFLSSCKPGIMSHAGTYKEC